MIICYKYNIMEMLYILNWRLVELGELVSSNFGWTLEKLKKEVRKVVKEGKNEGRDGRRKKKKKGTKGDR